MTDLFPDCKMDSPKLAWMKRHGVRVNYNRTAYEGIDEPDEVWPYEAYKSSAGSADHVRMLQLAKTGDLFGALMTIGPTEDDALCELAKANGWLLWFEES